MQQEFGFVPRNELQLSLPLPTPTRFATKRFVSECLQTLRDEMDADSWAKIRAEDQAENQQLYRR